MDKELNLTQEWDKVFPKSDKVEHEKIIFHNRFGINLVADLYKPKDIEGKLSALAVSGPFGAVKEQSSGLYAQEMAERGYLTIAFDPSFTGESGGEVRYMADASINTEDFQAAVDYLLSRDDVDSEKIGIIGICGWGGIALNAAGIDTRIKATIVSTMYDLARTASKGYFDSEDNEESRYQNRVRINEQRTKDYIASKYTRAGGVIDPVPDDAPEFVQQYHDYYKEPRGYHPRSLNSNDGWNIVGTMSYMNTELFTYANEIRGAVMIVHGDQAHSYYIGKDAYRNMIKDSKYADNKTFITVEGATHCDLYDQKDKIPFEQIDSFLKKYLK